jgi:hypothetical protein
MPGLLDEIFGVKSGDSCAGRFVRAGIPGLLECLAQAKAIGQVRFPVPGSGNRGENLARPVYSLYPTGCTGRNQAHELCRGRIPISATGSSRYLAVTRGWPGVWEVGSGKLDGRMLGADRYIVLMERAVDMDLKS